MGVPLSFWEKQIKLARFRDSLYDNIKGNNEKLYSFLKEFHVLVEGTTLYIILKGDNDNKFAIKVVESEKELILNKAREIFTNINKVHIENAIKTKYVFISDKYDLLKIRWSDGAYHEFLITLEDLHEIKNRNFRNENH